MNDDVKGRKAARGGTRNERYQLTIPLDASGIEDREDVTELKVAVRDAAGWTQSQTVKLDAKGQGAAKLSFEEQPGSLQVFVGPAEASDEELVKLQTLQFAVASRRWAEQPRLALPHVVIPPFHWHWWRRWCRTFVIRGRVVCPDGSPVPGADVCAYDVDWFFIWSSTQQVGCATTGSDGTFEITFRWCCGWWPWWWWRLRSWRLDPALGDLLSDTVRRNPALELAGIGGEVPALAPFRSLAGGAATPSLESLIRTDVSALDRLRDQLLPKLPRLPELERLRIWPWYPWHPWWDCTPDIIFRVTQDCATHVATIVDETVFDTRWNISNPLDVTLVANDQACCRPICGQDPCDEGECIIIDRVCNAPIHDVGGNLGAPATPAGYLNPGPVPVDTFGAHQPFGGIVPVYKNPGDLINVDYLEFEFSSDGGATWGPLPGDAGVKFSRLYWDAITSPPAVPVDFAFDSTLFPGHTVLETREHRETAIGGTWDVPGADHFWLSTNWDLLIAIASTKFDDGTYHFRAIGWDDGGGGMLVNRRVLPVCGEEPLENGLVLTFDNRAITAIGHDAAHLCGAGIHTCTVEPDTHILGVRVNGTLVGPCDTIDATSGTLEVDFLVTDTPSVAGEPGHLGWYVLESRWGLSQSRNLLAQASASVAVISGGPTGWAAGQTSGNYGTAVSQGAVAPDWKGGTFRLTITNLTEAFPVPCCYQLHLEAGKRTVVGGGSVLAFSCHGDHRNRTQLSLGIGVCGPE